MGLGIRIVDLTKRFGTHPVLQGLHWTVRAGCMTGLVGRSGAGKTTLLRILAGLARPDQGELSFFQENGTRADRRARVSMLFQDLALWPHLTAWEHLELIFAPLAKTARRERITGLFEEIRLPPDCWTRRPAALSGGEAQRLALARALATDPELLLLDEPLAQLDSLLRGELLQFIGSRLRARGTTLIYVTHAWSEVVEFCEEVAVLDAGRVLQSGDLADVYWRPISPLAARLTGPVSAIPAELLERGEVTCDPSTGICPASEGQAYGRILFRPQQVRFIVAAGANQWTVESCRPHGSGWRLELAGRTQPLQIISAAPAPREVRVGVHMVSEATLRDTPAEEL